MDSERLADVPSNNPLSPHPPWIQALPRLISPSAPSESAASTKGIFGRLKAFFQLKRSHCRSVSSSTVASVTHHGANVGGRSFAISDRPDASNFQPGVAQTNQGDPVNPRPERTDGGVTVENPVTSTPNALYHQALRRYERTVNYAVPVAPSTRAAQNQSARTDNLFHDPANTMETLANGLAENHPQAREAQAQAFAPGPFYLTPGTGSLVHPVRIHVDGVVTITVVAPQPSAHVTVYASGAFGSQRPLPVLATTDAPPESWAPANVHSIPHDRAPYSAGRQIQASDIAHSAQNQQVEVNIHLQRPDGGTFYSALDRDSNAPGTRAMIPITILVGGVSALPDTIALNSTPAQLPPTVALSGHQHIPSSPALMPPRPAPLGPRPLPEMSPESAAVHWQDLQRGPTSYRDERYRFVGEAVDVTSQTLPNDSIRGRASLSPLGSPGHTLFPLTNFPSTSESIRAEAHTMVSRAGTQRQAFP